MNQFAEARAPIPELPPLAGLCSMERALQADWSLDASVAQLKRLHYLFVRLYQTFTARITGEPVYELKTAFSHHAYLCAEQASAIRRRVSEMREPPLGLDVVPHPLLEIVCDEILCAPETGPLVHGSYGVAVPAAVRWLEQLRDAAHPLADAPTVRLTRHALLDLETLQHFGGAALSSESMVPDESASAWLDWLKRLTRACDDAAPDRLPERRFSQSGFQMQTEPRRDARFQDPYNAGVNPEAFLYDDRFSPRSKTVMMYYKRLRELDVPEMMATIQTELADEPWEFHAEMSRQLWDEARHAMMGEVGFNSLGIDWTQIPINFTWSRNLNQQLTARERHGVLFFIEQGLMPKTGKRYEWETGLASGEPLAGLFQDFDWADEVLHAQIGRRWYVPRFGSLQEAMSYGDRCWSQVLSHWDEDRAAGRTQHRNWWPEIYQQACAHWGCEPDAAEAAFDVNYSSIRADLQQISASG